MPRVTQQLATQIASKLTENKRKKEAAALEAFRTYCTELFEKQVPKEVMKLFKTHSEFIKTTSSARLNERGFSKTDVNLIKALPCTKDWYHEILLTDAEATKAKKLHNEWVKHKEERKDLFDETETALLNLRTFSGVEKGLPEAVPYLPQLGLSIVVDTEQLRKKLKTA